MISVVIRRLLSAVPIMLIVSLLTFTMIHLIPGDPAAAIAGLSATKEQVANIRRYLGLDQPMLTQLARWYGNLLSGDLGRSLLLGQPVLEATLTRLPVTLALSAYALVLTLLIGMGSGILAALRQNTWVDQAAMIVAMIGISVPNFYLGLLMILLFAVELRWLPTGGYVALTDDPLGWLMTSTMPAFSLALLLAGLLARITRSTMLEVLRQDYIRTARAKGLPEVKVLLRHALANAAVPIATVIGIGIALLIGGVVVTESVYAIPGLGRLTVDAVLARDFPTIQGVILFFSFVYVMVNLVVDLSYVFFDPRIRY